MIAGNRQAWHKFKKPGGDRAEPDVRGRLFRHNKAERESMDTESRNLHRLAFAVAGVLATAMAAVPAAAERPDLTPREVYETPLPPPASLPDRASESMEPAGGRVGSFILFPSAELSTAYDSNIFATSRNTESDIIFSVVPALRAQSDLAAPVRLNFDAVGVVNRYMDHNSEDTEGFLLSHDGSWQIPALGEASFLRWGLAHSRDWQDRGSPDDVTSGAAEPTILHTSLGYLGFQYKPGPLSISPRVSARHLDVDDVRNVNGAIINNDDRDRWTYREGLRVGYELVRGYEAYVRGSLNQRRYENSPDDAGFNRDSDGWEAVAGAKVGLTEVTNFDVYAGYLRQSYDDPRLSPVEGVGFGGQLNWSPRREWQVAASVTRSIEETIVTSFAGYLATTYAVSAAYQLMPALRFDARLSYGTFDFEPIGGSNVARQDDLLIAQIGVRYYLTPNYYVRASLVQAAYSSDVANSDYDRSIIYLTLGAQY
jgi:hypothetical protein